MTGEVSSTSRRRFARRQWWSRLVRIRLALALGILVVLGGALVWVVGFSSVLDVRGVQVTGLTDDSGLTPRDVEKVAALPYGYPLARVDLEAVRARVATLPAVRDVEVGRSWPHDVSLRIVERTAAAVWWDGERLQVIDPRGYAFRTVDRAPDGLTTVILGSAPERGADDRTVARTAPQKRALLAEGAKVARGLPASVARRVDSIVVGSVDSVRLRLTNGATVMWGSAEQSGRKAEVLEALLRQEREVYDVSVPGFPTVRG